MRLRIDTEAGGERERALDLSELSTVLAACKELDLSTDCVKYVGNGIWSFPKISKEVFTGLVKGEFSGIHMAMVNGHSVVLEDALDWWERKELTRF